MGIKMKNIITRVNWLLLAVIIADLAIWYMLIYLLIKISGK